MADKNLEKLLLAIETNDLKTIKKLIATDLEVVERRTVRGERPLESAIESENTTIIKKLIEVEANPNLIVADNLPLTTAASYGYLDIVKLLVKAGANVNLFDNNTGTTLEMAIINGHYDVFNYLAPLTSTDLRIWSEIHSLFISVLDENVKAINFLAQSGVYINQVFGEPLIKSLQDKDKEVRQTAKEALLKIIDKYPEIENTIPF